MAQGENAKKYGHAGADYWKKRGIFKRCKMWMAGISHNAGVNKKTKRLTRKSERQQEKAFVRDQAKEGE